MDPYGSRANGVAVIRYPFTEVPLEKGAGSQASDWKLARLGRFGRQRWRGSSILRRVNGHGFDGGRRRCSVVKTSQEAKRQVKVWNNGGGWHQLPRNKRHQCGRESYPHERSAMDTDPSLSISDDLPDQTIHQCRSKGSQAAPQMKA